MRIWQHSDHQRCEYIVTHKHEQALRIYWLLHMRKADVRLKRNKHRTIIKHYCY